jgi:hypothetical protein
MTGINLQQLRNELTDINAVLSSGVRESNVDGTAIKFDFEQLNRRKLEIESQLPETRRRRPRAFRVNFGG